MRHHPVLLDLALTYGIFAHEENRRHMGLELILPHLPKNRNPLEVCPTLLTLVAARPEALRRRMEELFILRPYYKTRPIVTYVRSLRLLHEGLDRSTGQAYNADWISE